MIVSLRNSDGFRVLMSSTLISTASSSFWGYTRPWKRSSACSGRLELASLWIKWHLFRAYFMTRHRICEVSCDNVDRTKSWKYELQSQVTIQNTTEVHFYRSLHTTSDIVFNSDCRQFRSSHESQSMVLRGLTKIDERIKWPSHGNSRSKTEKF